MSKLTLDQKISKTEESITKEEHIIEEIKEKIKKLKSELRTLKAEKEQSFANEILKLMKLKGISQENLMAQLQSAESQVPDKSFSSPNVTSDTTSSTENKINSSTSNGFQRVTNNSH